MTLQTLPRSRLASDPLTGRIGAELSGLDLRDLDDEDVADIRKALLAYRVVFFRGQQLDAVGQIRFARRLGPLTKSHPTLPPLTEDPEVLDMDSQGAGSANQWHTDVTFVQRPPTFSILRGVVIPEVGGDTIWANTVSAYEDLPDDLRAMADRLRALRSNGHDYGKLDLAKVKQRMSDEQVRYYEKFAAYVYETEHPVVRLHPETGERALLLGNFAFRLVGHTTQESADLIGVLQRYITRPENTVRWRWREGDVVIWDNRSTQHYAVADFPGRHRRVQRVTTDGVAPVGLDGRASVAVKGDATSYYQVA